MVGFGKEVLAPYEFSTESHVTASRSRDVGASQNQNPNFSFPQSTFQAMAQARTSDLSNLALRSASSLMALQLFSRSITFALNQALVRLASPTVYGTVSIQLELLLNTILFLSREGFRNALLRANTDSKQKEGAAHLAYNISLLPVYLGGFVSVLTTIIYTGFTSLETKSQPFFLVTVVLYATAALIELLSEPMHIAYVSTICLRVNLNNRRRSTQSLKPLVRVRAEGSALVVKSIATVLLLACDASGELALIAFGVGQLSYSMTMLFVYLRELSPETYFVFRRSPAVTSGKPR